MEQGTVKIHPVSYAYLSVQIGNYTITNIPQNELFDKEKHYLHAGLHNYVTSFTATRLVPQGCNSYFNLNGGVSEIELTVFDPTYTEFKALIREAIVKQGYHAVIAKWGLKKERCYTFVGTISQMTEEINSNGITFSLKLSPFEHGLEQQKLDFLSDDKLTVSSLMKDIYEKLHWYGYIYPTKTGNSWKNSSYVNENDQYCRSSKNYSSIEVLIRDNLIPLAESADEKYKDNPYVLRVDEQTGERYFCPDKMPVDILKTDKKTIAVNETEEFKKSFYFKQHYDVLKDADSNNNFTIDDKFISEFKMEELGGYKLSDFISFNKDLKTLDLYYGFKNSIVNSLSVNFDCNVFVTPKYYDFIYSEEDGVYESDTTDSDGIKHLKGEQKFKTVHRYMPEGFDEKTENSRYNIVRVDLQKNPDQPDETWEHMMHNVMRNNFITTYRATAELINWPYVSNLTWIRFIYKIPNGAEAFDVNGKRVVKDNKSYYNKDNMPIGLRKHDTSYKTSKIYVVTKVTDRIEGGKIYSTLELVFDPTEEKTFYPKGDQSSLSDEQEKKLDDNMNEDRTDNSKNVNTITEEQSKTMLTTASENAKTNTKTTAEERKKIVEEKPKKNFVQAPNSNTYKPDTSKYITGNSSQSPLLTNQDKSDLLTNILNDRTNSSKNEEQNQSRLPISYTPIS